MQNAQGAGPLSRVYQTPRGRRASLGVRCIIARRARARCDVFGGSGLCVACHRRLQTGLREDGRPIPCGGVVALPYGAPLCQVVVLAAPGAKGRRAKSSGLWWRLEKLGPMAAARKAGAYGGESRRVGGALVDLVDVVGGTLVELHPPSSACGRTTTARGAGLASAYRGVALRVAWLSLAGVRLSWLLLARAGAPDRPGSLYPGVTGAGVAGGPPSKKGERAPRPLPFSPTSLQTSHLPHDSRPSHTPSFSSQTHSNQCPSNTPHCSPDPT